MTFSSEWELRVYWKTMRALNVKRRKRLPPEAMRDELDDLEAIASHTKWPALRALTIAAIVAIRPLEAMAGALT